MSKRIFDGRAAAVAQVDTATPGAVDEGDTFTATLGNLAGAAASITVEADADDDVEDICDKLTIAAAAAGAPWTEVLVGDATTHITVTAIAAGTPFWLECSSVGGTFARAESVACGGPSVFKDGGNWLPDRTPWADGDELFIPADVGGALHDSPEAVNRPDRLTVERGFPYPIGTAARPLSLSMESQTTRLLEIAGTGAQWWRIDHVAAGVIRQAGVGGAEGDYACNLLGEHGEKLFVRPDDAAAGISVGTDDAGAVEWEIITWLSGAGVIREECVRNGAAALDMVDVRGGSVVCEATADIVRQATGRGECVYRGADAATVQVFAGTLRWDTDADVTELFNGGGGRIDFDAGGGAMAVGAAHLYEGFGLTDSRRRVTWTTGLDLHGVGPSAGELDLGVDFTLTPSEL